MGDESGEIALSLWSTGMIRLLRVGADWCPCSGPGGSEDERGAYASFRVFTSLDNGGAAFLTAYAPMCGLRVVSAAVVVFNCF